MGACNFIEFGIGRTKEEAFNALCQDAMEMYGIDAYNGTISTTELVRETPVVVQKNWGPRAKKKAIEIAKMNDYGVKWESRAIDCGKTSGGHMWAFYGWASC